MTVIMTTTIGNNSDNIKKTSDIQNIAIPKTTTKVINLVMMRMMTMRVVIIL